jgi:hypothetical protein
MPRSRRPAAVLAALAVALAGVAAWAGIRAAGDRPPAAPTTATAAESGPASPVAARVRLGDQARQVALGAGGLWVLGDRWLHRIGPAGDRVLARVPVGTATAPPGGLALSRDAAWVPAERSGLLWRVARAGGRAEPRARVDATLHGPLGVAVLGDRVWVSCCALRHGPRPAGLLLAVDARRGRVVARLPVPDGPLALLAHGEALWVATARGSVLKVDPASGRVVATVPPPEDGSRIQALSAGPDGIWAADTGAHRARRLDPATARFDLAVPAPLARNLGAGPAGVFVVAGLNKTLARVLPERGRLGAPVPRSLVDNARGVAVGADAVWVTTGREVVRIDPRRLPPPS